MRLSPSVKCNTLQAFLFETDLSLRTEMLFVADDHPRFEFYTKDGLLIAILAFVRYFMDGLSKVLLSIVVQHKMNSLFGTK